MEISGTIQTLQGMALFFASVKKTEEESKEPVLYKDFLDLLSLLKKHDVQYLIVGGYAVGIHGFERATKDLDLLVKVSPENIQRMQRAVTEFGFRSVEALLDDLLKPGTVIRLGREPVMIDLLTAIPRVDFDEAYTRRLMVFAKGIPISVIAKADLIANKQATGRDIDLLDVKRLDQGEV